MQEPNIVLILEDLAKVWNDLSPDTQKFLSTVLAGKRKGNNMVTNQILKEYDNFNKCPDCGGELHGTYEINREARDGEDPRIYGVICSDCSYENYD